MWRHKRQLAADLEAIRQGVKRQKRGNDNKEEDTSSDSSDNEENPFRHYNFPFRPRVLGKLLFKDAQAEKNVDVDILIGPGPQRKCVKAHKAVLAATSEVLSTQLSAPLWNINPQDGKIIEFPDDVGVEAAQAFIKYLYVEEVDAKLETDVLLEIMGLGDLYMVKELLASCDHLMGSRINVGNCITMYEKARRFDATTEVGGKALAYAKRKIEKLVSLANEVGTPCDWEAATWEALLKEDYLVVNEIELFLLLLKWKEEDVSRSEKFQELVQLIRYPLMGQRNFATHVVRSKALSSEDVISVFMCFDRDGTVETRFNCNVRRRRFASNTGEFYAALNNAVDEDILVLSEGTFEGDFVLVRNKVKIIGDKNNGTVIKGNCAITIEGSECILENITVTPRHSRAPQSSVFPKNEPPGGHEEDCSIVIIGNKNVLKNLKIGFGSNLPGPCGLLVMGDSNKISDIEIKHHGTTGVRINGKENMVSNVKVEGGEYGMKVAHEGNQLDQLSFINMRVGVELGGNKNSLTNVSFVVSPNDSFGGDVHAVALTGKYHFVENVVCEGVEGLERRWCIFMSVWCSNAIIRNCGLGQVLVKGMDHCLFNVRAGTGGTLRIGGAGHRFEECQADSVCGIRDQHSDTLTFVKCQFQ